MRRLHGLPTILTSNAENCMSHYGRSTQPLMLQSVPRHHPKIGRDGGADSSFRRPELSTSTPTSAAVLGGQGYSWRLWVTGSVSWLLSRRSVMAIVGCLR